MDILPIKFRSPPPKPPRRRHSEQLSISPAGTFPSSKKKYFDKNQCSNDYQEAEDKSLSTCGSLPADWTPDFSLEEKVENLYEFCNEKVSSANHIKNVILSSSTVQNFALDKHKPNLQDALAEPIKRTNLLQSKISGVSESKEKDFASSSEYQSTKLLKLFQTDMSLINSHKHILNITNSRHFGWRSSSKICHRRSYSDPLPTFDTHNSSSNFDSSIDTNCKYSSDYSCEVKEKQCLIKEMKSLKEINTKLWDHLCSIQASLDNLKKNSVDNSNSLSISDLMSSLYDSLKARDDAMEDRMKIILRERDNAIQNLDSLVQVLAKSFEDNHYSYAVKEDKSSDEEIKELLREIDVTYNPIKLLQQQRLLLSHLYKSKELKQDHMLHELKLITSERGNLRVKVKLLEEELNHIKLSNEIWETDNKFWESSLLNALCQVIQQRDLAVKNRNTTSTLEYLNCRSPIHEKSFSSEQINDCLQMLDGTSVKKKIFQSPQNDTRKFSPLSLKSKSDEISYLKEEILILNKSLEIEIGKRESAEEKCIRLERLVSVLQKKIIGQNVGIPV